MALVKLTREQVIDAFEANGIKLGLCPFSGHSLWNLVPHVVELHPFQRGGMQLPPPTVTPVVMLTCSGCGYTLSFSATSLGLVGDGDASDA